MKHIMISIIIFFLFNLQAMSQEKWTIKNPMPLDVDFEDVCFINPNTGWTVGRSGQILHTTDGGKNWSIVNTGVGEYTWFSRVRFVDSNNGWIVGMGGIILHTSDGGNTWRSQTSPTYDYLFDSFFIDSLFGWAVGQYGIILKTEDGGFHWTIKSENIYSSVNGVFFIDRNTGWATTTDKIIYTDDGGNTWETQCNCGWMYGVFFVD
jgi:photosystem II stability/assembly factor-like uncharacterized protein